MTEKDNLVEIKKPTKKEKNKYVMMGVTAFFTVAACIMFFFLVYRFDIIVGFVGKLIKSAEPIIIGLVLAYLLMPVKDFIEKPAYNFLKKFKFKEETCKNWARAISITGAIIALIIIIALLIAILVPALVSSIKGLVDAMPKYISSFVAWIEETGIADSSVAVAIGEYITGITTKLEEWAQTEILPLLQQYIGQITSGVYSVLKTLLNFVIGIIVMVYVMSIRETLVGQVKKTIYAIFAPKKGNLIITTVRKSNEIFGGFIIGKILDSAIIGVICYIGCLILRMPSPLLVAVIIGVTNVIPFFGPCIGAVPSILLVLIQSPIHGLYLAIFILVLQQVDGNIIGPKILGDTTGLSSFWVMFAILVGGGLFGFFGMLLGVPVFAVIYYICQQILKYQMEKRKLSNKTEDYIELVAIDAKEKTMIYPSKAEANEAAETK